MHLGSDPKASPKIFHIIFPLQNHPISTQIMHPPLLQPTSDMRVFSPFYAALSIRANEWLAMRTLSVWTEFQFARYVHMQNDKTLVEGLVVLEGRSWSVGSVYRYGFQAQVQDDELWKGAVNYKYRVEDPRLGRFFSVDALTMKYSFNSPFAFSENRVIDARELGGVESAFTKLNSVFKCTGIKRISLFGKSSQLRVNK
jgi:hypothetical protein